MLLNSLKGAVIHNHPIHYKHLLFREMKKQGLNFVVLFQAAQSSIRHERLPLTPESYRYRIAWDGPYETAPAMLRARWTWSALQKLSPEFLLISGYYAAECWSAWCWGILHRVPMFLWFESNEFDYKRYWFKEIPKRIFLKGCRGAHVYGLSHKAYLMKLGMPAENIAFKRSVADIETFDTPAGEKSNRSGNLTRIIYVGRLAPEKNVAILLNALAYAIEGAPQSGLHLIIAGTGPDEARLRQQTSDLGIGDRVEFVGYVPQQDLVAFYRKADFFVLPSIREPWGLVALEAMLCRLPVILSTQCGCAADMVTPETGWAFSPWNEKELGTILKSLESISSERIQQMGDAAHGLAAVHSSANCAFLISQALNRDLGTSEEAEERSGVNYAG
jgi:glycosyltransferase involved in cell wall biosynthesis